MESKIRHLEMIQGIINRMAGNLFYLRGWTLTLYTAVLALTAQDADYMWAIYLPLAIFWSLDGFFLSQERQFRGLYDRVRELPPEEVDFSMNTARFAGGRNSWPASLFSATLLFFYVPLWVVALIVTWLNR